MPKLFISSLDELFNFARYSSTTIPLPPREWEISGSVLSANDAVALHLNRCSATADLASRCLPDPGLVTGTAPQRNQEHFGQRIAQIESRNMFQERDSGHCGFLAKDSSGVEKDCKLLLQGKGV